MGYFIKLGKPFYLTLTYVVIFPGIAAFFFWIKGISIIGANRAGVFLHLMPIFGAIMAMIIFDEKFMFYHFLGAIFIILGITLSNKKNQMLKVAILDDYQNVSQHYVNLKKLSGKYEIKVFNEPFEDQDDAIEKLRDFEALIIMRERTAITSNLINNLKKLKFITTSGMRNKAIDLEAAEKRKIIVSGTEINVNPTSELTWALILGLARNIKLEIDNMFQGYWQTTIGVELKGKILGLIGLGKVGSQVAKIAKVFGMQVMAWSENLNLDKCKELDVLPSSKEDLITNSDFISIHVQGGERYKNCITLKEFDKMKKTSFLINTSRGPIVNEDDLIIALSTNVIAGAGIDVYEKEPLPSDHKLRFIQNALILPHIGYVTAENYSIFYPQMFENLEACVLGKPIRVIKK